MMRTKPKISRRTNMAAGEKRNLALLACVLYVLFGQTASQGAKDFPSMKMVSSWAGDLGNNLVTKYLDSLIGLHAANLSYHEVAGLNFNMVEEDKLVQDLAKKLSRILSKKTDTLRDLVLKAEEDAVNYVYDPQLKKGQVSYHNSKDMGGVKLRYNSHFKQDVNLNFSSVHIPAEIRDGDVNILNGIKWTAVLDEQLRKNYKEDPQILWQFFGSHTGFMRTYPASKWKTRGQDDLFDVRLQTWYTQGSSSPKDMMILIDTSSSTHGHTLQLMKDAVKSILDTLGENDFVNIVSFSAGVGFVSPCFNHTALVQANIRNKKQLAKDVEKLHAQGQADYEKGLVFAFEKFDEFNKSRTDNDTGSGANCNKMILVLSDGGTENAEKVFKEYNWPHKSVRVFTYAVGPPVTPVNAIRWMACANRGYFSRIPAVEDIQAGVKEYIPVLSRPLVLKNVKSFEWSNLYKDHLGPGMMITVTLPVFNRTVTSHDWPDQTILGVMGIDFAAKELGKHTPYLKVGPMGYSFAINPNGYAVFHPNLKDSGRYMKDPPNTDLLELEQEQEEGDLMKLRNQMVEGVSDTMDIQDALFLSPDKKYVTKQRATYAFTDISDTVFRLGLSVPEFQRWYPSFKNTAVLPDFQLSAELKTAKIAPWDYLGTLPQQQNLDNSLAKLVDVLNSGDVKASNFSEDQLHLLHHLAMDVKICQTMVDYNKAYMRSKSELEWTFAYRFMATNGGLTYVYPTREARKFAYDLDIQNYYKRSMLSNNYIISAETMEDKTHSYITASHSITMKNKYRVAVVGVTMDANRVRKSVLDILSKRDDSNLTCDDVDNIACYLIDDGGFMIISNQDNNTFLPGHFLGEVDSQLWNALLTHDIFGRTVQYNFQAICDVKKPIISAGPQSFFVPSFTMLFEMLTTGWWTSKVSWAFSSFGIYNWLFGYPGVYGGKNSGEEKNKDEEDCVLATQQFYLRRPEGLPYSLNISCTTREGLRKAQIDAVPGTNLLLVVSHLSCGNNPPVSHKPYKISEKEEEKLVCSMARQPHKRARPSTCYDHHPLEDDSKCDAAAHPSSRLLSVTAACIAFITAWLLSGDHR